MKITWFQCHLFYEEAASKLATSYGPAMSVRPHVLLELRTDDGQVGYGEASPLSRFTGETAESIKLILEKEFLPAIMGSNPMELAAVHSKISYLPGNQTAKCCLDMALHDLVGRAGGQPVYNLLGGAFRDAVPVTRPLGILPIEDAVEQATYWVSQGYRTLKMKVGESIEADIARIRAVREAVGREISIRIDANQGYRVPEAIRLARGLEGVGIEYFEQPVGAWDLEGLAEVRRATGLPVAADESLQSLRAAMELAHRRAVDVFVIKLIKLGGLFQARKVAAIAEAAGIDLVVVSPFETHLGAAAGIHFALSSPLCQRAQELSIFLVKAGRPGCQLAGRNGSVDRPSAPGLGVDGAAILAGAEAAAPPESPSGV